MKKIYPFLILLVLASSFIAKTNTPPQKMKAIKTNIPINLDGVLDDAVWHNKATENFIQRDPKEGEPATERTEVWIAYDESSLYVAARLFDKTPNQIDASLSRKDNWVESDWIVFYISPHNDNKNGYYFAVNPAGTLMDGILYNDSWDDDSWDGIWEAKAKIDTAGWTAEMKIPFSQLRFKEAAEMKWGVNFQRKLKKNNEQDYFVMVPKEESGFVSRFATLEGLDGIKPKQRFEFFPYVVQKAQYLNHESGDPFYKSNQYKTNIGADIKIGVGTNLNLDIAVNPDFGQVEVDPAVVNLSASENYYDEKRPFFLEGNSIFYTGIYANNNWGFNMGWPDIFYSRRIGRPPQGDFSDENSEADYTEVPGETNIITAAKLTGRTGEWTIGAISAVTERTYGHAYFSETATEVEEEIEPLTHYGVFKAKREVNDGMQGFGFMFTSVNRDLRSDNLENSLTRQAYTYGIDGFTFLDGEKEYIISASAIGSYASGSEEAMTGLQKSYYRYLQRPDATFMKMDTNRTSLSGSFARIMLNKQHGAFYINSAVGIITPGFEYNDLGYQWMADKINAHTIAGYRWYEPDGIFKFKRTYFAYANEHDFDGNITNNRFYMNNYAEFENSSWIWLGGGYNFESFSKSVTRGGPIAKRPVNYWYELDYNTDERKPVVGYICYYYSGNKMGTTYHLISTSLEFKPMTQLYFSFEPELELNYDKDQYVTTIEDESAVNTYGHRYIFGEIDQITLSADIRLNWTFTPTLSVQLFVQPLFSVGDYENYKEFAAPRTYDFNKYGSNGSTISYDAEDEEYTVDPDGNGNAESFTFDDPDFNYKSFKANLIFRWEVMPGSIFFFAWTHDRTNGSNPGNFRLGRDFSDLWGAPTDNIFLIKFTHWLHI